SLRRLIYRRRHEGLAEQTAVAAPPRDYVAVFRDVDAIARQFAELPARAAAVLVIADAEQHRASAIGLDPYAAQHIAAFILDRDDLDAIAAGDDFTRQPIAHALIADIGVPATQKRAFILAHDQAA